MYIYILKNGKGHIHTRAYLSREQAKKKEEELNADVLKNYESVWFVLPRVIEQPE